MEKAEENLISIEAPKTDFEKFLDIKNNKRIFFSGKFGIGKTFFLQKFFKEHEDKYDTYHLFPVRYQITTNESIVDLLKYDILVELLKNHPEAFSEKKIDGITGWVDLFSAFLRETGLIGKFLRSIGGAGGDALAAYPDPLFQLLGKLGRPLKELASINKKFREFKKEYTSKDKLTIERFFSKVEEDPYAVATDYLSYLLRVKIAEQRGDQKKSVLILDDFDRIDPDHIFRIFNVLSAHMEGDEDNKFGFDRIIIVGDVKNIQNVFRYRYGDGAEFSGYFDKFFTVEPYIFNNDKAIAERIPLLIKQIQYGEPELRDALDNNGIVQYLMREVLGRAFEIKLMSVRQLYKPINNIFPEVRKGSYIKDSSTDGRNQFINIGIKMLIAMYGEDDFLVVLRKIRDKSSPSDVEASRYYKEYANSMLKRIVPPGINSTIWLEKYQIKRDSNGNIYPSGDTEENARFFYDTLVEYVEQKKYEKQSMYDYEK
jgi:hypothetical protein